LQCQVTELHLYKSAVIPAAICS